jgi:hypothetical protein
MWLCKSVVTSLLTGLSVDMQTLSIEILMLWMLLPPLQASKDLDRCDDCCPKASWVRGWGCIYPLGGMPATALGFECHDTDRATSISSKLSSEPMAIKIHLQGCADSTRERQCTRKKTWQTEGTRPRCNVCPVRFVGVSSEARHEGEESVGSPDQRGSFL